MEVDYLFGAKDENFFQQMEALPKRFDLGMFAKLEEKLERDSMDGASSRRVQSSSLGWKDGV